MSRIRRLSTVTAILIAAGVTASPASAQQGPETIQTDRPDITEGSIVVGKGRVQLETGFYQEYFNGRRLDERSIFTPTLLRVGFHRRWEARVETQGFSHTRFSAPGGVSRTSGYSPFDIGAKYHFQDVPEGSRRPSLGAIMHLKLPSGSGFYRARKLTGSLRLAADWELSPKWSLGANAGILVDEGDTGETFTGGLASSSLGYAVNDRLSAFLELAFQSPEADAAGSGLILDGGFLYLLNRDTQLDVAFGTGLSGRTAADFFWTVGISRRW